MKKRGRAGGGWKRSSEEVRRRELYGKNGRGGRREEEQVVRKTEQRGESCTEPYSLKGCKSVIIQQRKVM